MADPSRRHVLALAARAAAGAALLQLPPALLTPSWTKRAEAAAPGVEGTFVALVDAVTNDPSVATAQWMVTELDKALKPTPEVTTSALLAAVLDEQSLRTVAKPFALGTRVERQRVLEGMVKDPLPEIRQIVNQVMPFTVFAYWTDATLPPPARPGGPRLARWDRIGFPGPSHDYLKTFRDGRPRGFHPTRQFER